MGMSQWSSGNFGRLPLKPLAACLALAFGTSETVHAATLLVTDCTDGTGSGTLRNTISAAASGDTVQIPATCSTITLATGAIFIEGKTALTITGPGIGALTINGGFSSTPRAYNQVFLQLSDGGSLSLSGMTITGGKYKGNAFPSGGCLYSAGDLILDDVSVKYCALETSAGPNTVSKGGAIYAKGAAELTNSYVYFNEINGASEALGAGIYAQGGVILTNSVVSENFADGGAGYLAEGAGVYAKGNVILSKSSIKYNGAYSGSGAGSSRGGGLFLVGSGDISIKYSTISNNRADRNAGLQVNSTGSGSYTVSVKNSTISDNTANDIQAAGTYLPTTISNSTIAFNKAFEAASDSPAGFYSNQTISMQSSIFANNIGALGGEYDVGSTTGLTGANNLIVFTTNSVPLGTLNSCPRLGPLANNGGPTATVPLLDGSPAINAGNNSLNLTDDQRGTGFQRVAGASADIGAYELQSGVTPDRIFAGEFEGRCE
jgi:hypothetical protein